MTPSRNRLGGAGAPVDVPAGWRWVCTRGHDLPVPVSYAFRWMASHAPPEAEVAPKAGSSPTPADRARIERRDYPKRGLRKVTRWEVLPPDRVVFHDQVFQRGRLVVEGEERYRFMGADGLGCIVEVTTLHRPVGWVSRAGFALFPEWSVRTRRQEAELLREIERDFRVGGSPVSSRSSG